MPTRIRKAINCFYSEAIGSGVTSATPEAANVRTVTIQLVDAAYKNIAFPALVEVWISDAPTGAGLCAAAPSGGVAIGANGAIFFAQVAGKLLLCQTNTTGRLDLTITEVAVKTFYVVAKLPDGSITPPFPLAYA